MSSVTMSVVQQVSGTVTALDIKGNPASLQGVPAWAVSDTTIVSAAPAADGMSALFTALGKEGTVTVTVDAVNTAGHTLTTTGTITVVAAVAASLGLTFGTPVDQAPPPPPPPPAP